MIVPIDFTDLLDVERIWQCPVDEFPPMTPNPSLSIADSAWHGPAEVIEQGRGFQTGKIVTLEIITGTAAADIAVAFWKATDKAQPFTVDATGVPLVGELFTARRTNLKTPIEVWPANKLLRLTIEFKKVNA